jgi:hypothetical protein
MSPPDDFFDPRTEPLSAAEWFFLSLVFLGGLLLIGATVYYSLVW